MRKQMLTLLALLMSVLSLNSQQPEFVTSFEKSDGKETATYAECIDYYTRLSQNSPRVNWVEYGTSDIGKPIHLAVITDGKDFRPNVLRKKGKLTLMINNAIHPGEPCGVDASMMLARELAFREEYAPLLEHVNVIIVPMFNIGGALNRNSHSRANQMGPVSYGFRGNAKNLDLNRDFIKMDSKNAKTFVKIFREWMPDVFIDTHTSNGADYQYTMTLITTQRDKLQPDMSTYMIDQMMPKIQERMDKTEYLMGPYVNTVATVPDSGISEYLETPRYTTGYAALYNSIAFVTEAHMLKSFEDRVYSTYYFLMSALKVMNQDRVYITRARKKALEAIKSQQEYTIRWRLNEEKFDKILFKGYTFGHKASVVSGQPRLFYDQNAPWEKEIPFYHYYDPEVTVKAPIAYVIPQSWERVIENLKLNKVTMKQVWEDAKVNLHAYYIEDYQSLDRAWEGHYFHFNIKTRKEPVEVQLYKGDYVVFVNQDANRYIVETLEPQAHDAFFAWNYFDEILMQKEYFSSYVFEDTAEELLEKDPELREKLKQAVASDSVLAANPRAQLDFVYKHSPYYEPTHLRYPVFRMEENLKLSLK